MRVTILLLISVIILSCSLLGRYRVPYNGHLCFPTFFISWLTSELAWLHVLIQMCMCIVFIAAGSLNYWQGQMALVFMAASILLLCRMHLLSLKTGTVFNEILKQQFGQNYVKFIAPERKKHFSPRYHAKRWLFPFKMRRKNVIKQKDISYGEDVRHRLDIYHNKTLEENSAPVLFYIHGGGWVAGNKEQQALPLIYHLAERGWIVVSINYRLGPKHRFPSPLIDAKQALAWVKLNIQNYGGDPNFIVTSGGSAGGHLALLLALTNDPDKSDSTQTEPDVAACVSLYAVYDFINRHHFRRDNAFNNFLTRYIMPASVEQDSRLWEELSPMSQIHSEAPPMLIIHGSNDALVPIEEAREFFADLKSTAKKSSALVELEAAQHAFEIFHSVRTEFTIDAIHIFLEILYNDYSHIRLWQHQ